MTAKQFLSRGRWIEREITSLIRTRDETRDRLTHITQNYDGDGAQTTKDPHKFDSLVELEDKIDELIDRLYATKTEILGVIDKLEDRREFLTLKVYYIDMKTWEEVCVELHYSWRQTMYIRKQAIKHVDERLGEFGGKDWPD